MATPIGHLSDMGARAVEVLKQVDVIAAEDTRHSSRLLQAYGIGTPCLALHEHNEQQQVARITQRLLAGESVALISDAGTPLVSDPGYHLVRQVRQAGVRVSPVPGPSALIAALSVSGLPTDRFVFEGFLSAKSGARRQRLAELAGEERTLVFYEAPHRILDTVADLAELFGPEREAVLARELTKNFETVRADSLQGLHAWASQDANQQRGEIVLLVHGAAPKDKGELSEESRRILVALMEELSVSQAVALAVRITGVSKKVLYAAALAIKGE